MNIYTILLRTGAKIWLQLFKISATKLFISRGTKQIPANPVQTWLKIRVSYKNQRSIIFLSLRRSDELPSQLYLQPNEYLANRIIQMSPEGTRFLKPVTMDIPHFAVLQGKRRELIVLTCNHGHSHWKDHTHPLMEEKEGKGLFQSLFFFGGGSGRSPSGLYGSFLGNVQEIFNWGKCLNTFLY